MTAAILAGGQATRMGDLCKDRPKCMVEVAGKPILAWQAEALGRAGVDKMLVLAGAGFSNEWMEYARFHLSKPMMPTWLECREESGLLGTAGALWNARESLGDRPFLVLNGDIIPGFSLEPITRLRHFAAYREDWLAAVGVRWMDNPGPFGHVKVHFDRRVHCFSEPPEEMKPMIKESGPAGYVNAGIYLLSPKILDGLKPLFGDPVSLERSTFPVLAERGKLLAHNFIGPWYAIDTPEDVKRAEEALA